MTDSRVERIKYLIDTLNEASKAYYAQDKEIMSNFEYDKLYDAPTTGFSAENAEKIEISSWDTTKILVEAFEDEEQKMKYQEEEKKIESPVVEESEDGNDLRSALGNKYEFLTAALAGDKARQNQVAKRLLSMPDAIADEINEIAAELLGDIILEEDDGDGYRVIEEYREVIL